MAIERDRNDAVGLAIYGHLQSYLLKDYDAARNYLERALTAGPSCAWAWAYSSLTCGYLGDAATALTRAERAVRLSPLGADAFWLEHYLSQAYYLGNRHDEAIAWARVSAARAAGNTSNLRCLSPMTGTALLAPQRQKLARFALGITSLSVTVAQQRLYEGSPKGASGSISARQFANPRRSAGVCGWQL